MFSKIICTLPMLCLALTIFTNNFESVDAQCGPDMNSTLAIVGTLCIPGNHEDDVAFDFFACYSGVPGQAYFAKCQGDVFGGPLNSKENIARTCANAGQLPLYVECLTREFTEYGMDLVQAVTRVNACQGKLMGLC